MTEKTEQTKTAKPPAAKPASRNGASGGKQSRTKKDVVAAGLDPTVFGYKK